MSDVFFTNGRVSYIRICDGVFSLEVDGETVIDRGTYEQIHNYAKAEFGINNPIAPMPEDLVTDFDTTDDDKD